ncbi:MAG: hypothetical protein U5L03_00825 [Burkholderiaceae bacterium]|nr:hypothetical protein [Burkholderiaceae bacterium]
MSEARVMQSMKRTKRLRSMRESVREIEHSSNDHAFFSCDQIRLRVKRDLKFGCSISLINKRRSTTELNSDSRPQHFIVKRKRRLASRTLRFCGVVPTLKSESDCAKSKTVTGAQRLFCVSPDAGFAPAFVFRRDFRAGLRSPLDRIPPASASADRAIARGLTPPAARGTAFISVSGLCPERSALHSDLRLKRFSGSVAAPELPHAPMNSPAAHCAGFPS